jgi:hypothetical protein
MPRVINDFAFQMSYSVLITMRYKAYSHTKNFVLLENEKHYTVQY